jgi:5'-phosphate synthase pdxT subunit
MAMRVGVLALQGDFIEHVQLFRALGVEALEIRKPEELERVDALVIPGGESTTFGKLAAEYGLIEPMRERCLGGTPVWGTCAGMILLAKDVGRPQPILGVMDLKVRRNAFGRQTESFEQDLDIPALASVENGRGPNRPFHAIFIRAPVVESVGKDVEVLARLEDGTIVAAQQGNLLATAFHPELTQDTRFHRYFLERVRRGR